MRIVIPEFALVVLIGPSGAGKSSFARQYFKPTEIISSDRCRGLVADDENDQNVTKDAFEILHFIAAKRLRAGRLTVIDATNVKPEARKSLLELASEYHCLPVAIVFDLPETLCHERNQARTDRNFGSHVIRQQYQKMHRSLRGLGKEGFRKIFTLKSLAEVENVTLERERLWNNLQDEHGPFDIIGDLHGCFDELQLLLKNLGYQLSGEIGEDNFVVTHPEGRRVIFLGDLVDRGLKIVSVLKLVMGMVRAGTAFCVPGNHERKLIRKLEGHNVQITHGLAETLAQLAEETPEFLEEVKRFLDKLISHYVLDDGKLVVVHAGMKEEYQGRGSKVVREFALFGETTGETDEFGLPVRYHWATDYRGKAMVVYGHTPVAEATWLNQTIDIDTGCVFGGKLTALRYPEKELLSVPAFATYYEPAKPFFLGEQVVSVKLREADDALKIEDVLGKRILETRLYHNITIQEENALAALEVMSRFAADPHWLIYLPPTMSPTETSQVDGFLEHPREAFNYFRNRGVTQVVCEEKHMGSRAVVVVCRSAEVAERQFQIKDGSSGVCYTRTGRHFFLKNELEAEFIERMQTALTKVGFWERFQTEWFCFDCELMPWSAKAQALLQEQYAPVGVAGTVALREATRLLKQAQANGVMVGEMPERFELRAELLEKYVTAYQKYCWSVKSITDLKLAPFHLLAAEGKTYTDQDHLWQMSTLADLAAADPELMLATNYKLVDLADPVSEVAGISWWQELTQHGGEGMVVKSLDFIVKTEKELVQPAVKCRGQEYLRIIYGPEYTLLQNLERLRKRSLSKKRSLALREFSLGIEALERFVRQEPLYRVHECVFGILALESEPVDPRL